MAWGAKKGQYCYDNDWPRAADQCEAGNEETIPETATRCGLDPREWWRGRNMFCGNTALDHMLCTWGRDMFVPNWNAFFAAPDPNQHRAIFAAAVLLFFGVFVKKAIDLLVDFIKELAELEKKREPSD
jgi:hypothetical protein